MTYALQLIAVTTERAKVAFARAMIVTKEKDVINNRFNVAQPTVVVTTTPVPVPPVLVVVTATPVP
eukprot:COSAG06_NODE_51073_length_314_cov_1.162791_2_plen_65_part_01